MSTGFLQPFPSAQQWKKLLICTTHHTNTYAIFTCLTIHHYSCHRNLFRGPAFAFLTVCIACYQEYIRLPQHLSIANSPKGWPPLAHNCQGLCSKAALLSMKDTIVAGSGLIFHHLVFPMLFSPHCFQWLGHTRIFAFWNHQNAIKGHCYDLMLSSRTPSSPGHGDGLPITNATWPIIFKEKLTLSNWWAYQAQMHTCNKDFSCRNAITQTTNISCEILFKAFIISCNKQDHVHKRSVN